MTLSDTLRLRLRRKIGDRNADGDDTNNAFTNAELDDIWEEAGEDMAQAVRLCISELLINAAKRYDYTRGMSQEKQSQVFRNLQETYAIVSAQLGEADQMRIVGMRRVPPKRKDAP